MHRGTRFVLFALVALLLLPHFAAAQDQEVEMSVRNRTSHTVTVFALWDRGTRARLGDLRANQTQTFTVEINGERVTLSVQVAGQRGATAGGPRDFAEVRAGESISWEIRGTDPLDLLYRSAAAAGGGGSVSDLIAGLTAADAEPGTPRMSPFTSRSQGGIQQAQAMEDDSLRVATYRDILINIREGIEEEEENTMAFLHLGIVNAGIKK